MTEAATASQVTMLIDSEWAQVDGWRMHARRALHAAADAPVVVLVHGLGMSHRYMMPTLRSLAPRARVYAPDLPGFGKSDKPPLALDVPELARALDGWARAVGLHRAVFVGNSFGCQILVELTMRNPELISSLVLVAPTIDRQARTVREQLIRLLLDAPRERLSLVPLALREYFFTVGFTRALQTLRYAIADPIEDKLPHVSVPTLVVRGSRDMLVPQAWTEEVTRLLPHGRLVVLPKAAHAVNHGAPEQLARVVIGFITTATHPTRIRRPSLA